MPTRVDVRSKAFSDAGSTPAASTIFSLELLALTRVATSTVTSGVAERLARCGHWSAVADTSPRGRVWVALAGIVAGHVMHDAPLVVRSWSELRGEFLLYSWEPLSWIVMGCRGGMQKSALNLLSLWPDEMATLLTRLISRRTEWESSAPFHKALVEIALDRFVAALGDVGGQVSRGVLLELVDRPKIGVTARDAIRRIDDRTLTR